MNERDDRDERLSAQARRLFDESVQRLDGQTLSRLNRGRQRALAELGRHKRYRIVAPLVPAAGVAAAAALAIVLWNGRQQVPELTPPSTATDLEILLEDEEFDMLQELDFYSWMELDANDGANVG